MHTQILDQSRRGGGIHPSLDHSLLLWCPYDRIEIQVVIEDEDRLRDKIRVSLDVAVAVEKEKIDSASARMRFTAVSILASVVKPSMMCTTPARP